MDIRHKVAIEGCRDTKGPDAISQRPPDVDIEDLAHGRESTACLAVGGFVGQKGPVGQAGQHQHEHDDAEDAHGVMQANVLQQSRHHEGQNNCEEAAAGRHDAIDQTQAFLEIVAQDDEAGLVGKGAATGEHNAVGEIHGY